MTTIKHTLCDTHNINLRRISLQGNDIFLLLRPVLLLKLLSENSNPQKFLELYYLD